MSSKIENLFNLTNYRDHPENKDYKVFFYYNKEQADHFESLLIQEAINYESYYEKDSNKPIMLFGIHNREFRKAEKLNTLSYAAFKKSFIPNKWLRNAILIITFGLVLFALIGYLSSK